MSNAITIAILANGKQARAEFEQTATAAQKIGGGFKKALVPALAVGAGIGAIGTGALKAVANVERINAQTTAVVKSTGGAAGVTAGHVEGLANKLEGLTTTEAEATQEGANLLLTFTNIRNEAGKGNAIFDRTTGAMVDLARAMGTEPKAAAIQLGKALNDPIKGVGALSRVGVSFTEQQKKTIKSLVDGGNVMGAQKIILKELEKQFGGSGEAFAKTAEGKTERIKNAFGNVTEGLVVGLLPTFTKLADAATKGLAWAEENPGKVKGFAIALAAVVGAVVAVNAVMAVSGAVMATYRGIVVAISAVTKVWTGVQWLLNAAMTANPIGLIVLAIVALVAIFVIAWKKSETFRTIVTGAWNGIKTAAVAVFGFLRGFLSAVWSAIKTVVTTQVRIVLTVVRAVWNGIKAATSAVWNGIKAVVGAVIRAVVTVVRTQVTIAKTVLLAAWNAAKAGTTRVWNGIKEGVRTAIAKLVEFVRGIKAKVTGIFSAAGTWLLSAGKRIVQGLLDGITGMISRVRSKLSELTNLIPDWKGPAERDAKLLRPAGELIIGGLVDGLDRQTPKVKRFLGDLSKEISTFDANPTGEVRLTGRDVHASVTAAGRDRTVTVKLTAEQASAVQQGREVTLQLRAYQAAGGRTP